MHAHVLPYGVYRNLPSRVYDDDPGVRSSILKKLKSGTPAHLWYAMQNPDQDTAEALLRGQVLHAMLLEPERENDYFVFETFPLGSKTTLAKNGGSKELWDAMKKEALERGVPLVPYSIYSQCIAMRDNVQAHELWMNIGKHAEKELSIFTEINGVRIKVRLDAYLNGMIADLKTTRHRLTKGNMEKIIVDENYHVSAAMYMEAAKAIGLEAESFVWVFVESNAPNFCRFGQATPEMLETGRIEFYKLLEKYKTCSESGTWEAYPLDIEMLDLPAWYAKREFEELA